MKAEFPDQPDEADPVAAAAAAWVACHDRGLTPEEQDRYLQWLRESPRHGEAMTREHRTWETLDRLAGLQTSWQAVPNPDLLAPPRPARRNRIVPLRRGFVPVVLAAAAAVALLLYFASPPPAFQQHSAAKEIARLARIEERTLTDGSVVRLNRGAEIAIAFTASERRVVLVRGEAAFEVTKDPARPFVVQSGGVTVRAIGTVFNVRLADGAVDVIVTEGRVAVLQPTTTVDAAPKLDAGQRMLVPLEEQSGLPVVSTPSSEELARRLAWQPRMLVFTDESLGVIINEFNRHNPVSLRLDDPELPELRLSARIRSDNLPAFLRVLESEFKVTAELQAGGQIVLRRAR